MFNRSFLTYQPSFTYSKKDERQTARVSSQISLYSICYSNLLNASKRGFFTYQGLFYIFTKRQMTDGACVKSNMSLFNLLEQPAQRVELGVWLTYQIDLFNIFKKKRKTDGARIVKMSKYQKKMSKYQTGHQIGLIYNITYYRDLFNMFNRRFFCVSNRSLLHVKKKMKDGARIS